MLYITSYTQCSDNRWRKECAHVCTYPSVFGSGQVLQVKFLPSKSAVSHLRRILSSFIVAVVFLTLEK